MPAQPPQQLFDGSYYTAILATPPLEVAPPEVDIEPVEDRLLDEAIGEIETFDWESYNHAFFERIPDSAKRTEEGRNLAQIAGTQLWMARRLPPEAIAFLLRATPTKLLWAYLNGPDRQDLLKMVTKGFQRTPPIVRQPVVRNRWLQWLTDHTAEVYVLLVMWSFNEPSPPIIEIVRSEPEDEELTRRLPLLFRKFGVECTLSALSFAARPRVFRAVAELLADKDELERVMQDDADDEELISQAQPELPPEGNTADEASDPDTAEHWRRKFEEACSSRTRIAESLEKVLENSARLTRSLARQKEEMELLHKREKVATEQWTRKLEGAQKRAQSEADELRKNSERLNRKIRTLEREKDELEIENRRLKKQLHHSGLLLEEERRKKVQPEKPKAAAPPPAAPKPAVVSKPLPPTPLDEVFEWRADGRPVKVTPRAVRQLIERNDEDAVFAIVQALDSLKSSDASKRTKFLQRLGEAGGYYPRVLTQSMSRVLVDASNVARHVANRRGKGQLTFLIQIREELRRLNCFPILFYADASLRHNIDDAGRFSEMVERGEIILVDKGVEADEILAREARRTGAYVVTNDARFFHKVSPDFEPPRIGFRVLDGTVIVEEF